MAWNWQHTDWPNFIWQRENRDASERAFIEGAGVIIGASKHLVPSEQQRLSVELLSHEAIDTSAIEASTWIATACNPPFNDNWAWRLGNARPLRRRRA